MAKYTSQSISSVGHSFSVALRPPRPYGLFKSVGTGSKAGRPPHTVLAELCSSAKFLYQSIIHLLYQSTYDTKKGSVVLTAAQGSVSLNTQPTNVWTAYYKRIFRTLLITWTRNLNPQKNSNRAPGVLRERERCRYSYSFTC